MSTTSSPSSSSVVQVGTLPKFLNQWRSSTYNRLVFNMVKGHYLQLRSHSHYSVISNGLTLRLLWFIIQKVVDELLAKSNVIFIVLRDAGGFMTLTPVM